MFVKYLMTSVSLLCSKNGRLKTVRTLITALDNQLIIPFNSKWSFVREVTKPLVIATYGSSSNAPGRNGYDESKAKIILQLNFKSDEDVLPFYKLPLRTLSQVLKVTQNDQRNGFCENRLYYIASHIECPPNVVSEQLAKRTFVYLLTFDWLKKSLEVLLEMGVSGDRILRDLWVLKYHHETIRKRLTRVQNMGVDILYPWMVRCSEDILNRSIQLTQETKDILGEAKTTQKYLANRLNISTEDVEEMFCKMPALKTMRVIKVKKFLDFLIAEGFTVEDIATKPRVLSASQKTVQQRLYKLRNIGLTQINLNVLCRSRKSFRRFCESMETLTENYEKA